MSANYVEDFSDVTDDDLKGGPQYPAEGQYFLLINNVDDSRTRVDGLEVEFVVYAGTVDGQNGKKFHETFFDPKPENKDGGKFLRARRIKLFLATGIATSMEELRTPGFQWSPDMLTYRCIKAAIVHTKSTSKKNGKEYTNAQIDGLDGLMAPNDPDAAHIPVDAETLSLCFDNGQANAVMPVGSNGSGPNAAGTPVEPKKPAPPKAPGVAASTQPAPAQPAAAAAKQGALPGTAPAQKAADPYAAL